jgi:hypothetical protein
VERLVVLDLTVVLVVEQGGIKLLAAMAALEPTAKAILAGQLEHLHILRLWFR